MHLILNLNLWAAIAGFSGTILIYHYGLSNMLADEGYTFQSFMDVNISENKTRKRYVFRSRLGIVLLGVSFLLQAVNCFI